MTFMIKGTLKLNMLIFNSSYQTRKIAHIGGYFINLLTFIWISICFVQNVPTVAVDKLCSLNASLIIGNFGIMGVVMGA